MAAPGDDDNKDDWSSAAYLVVSGIPGALRSAQLRDYFSQFREQGGGGFLCFHYRHRPERGPGPGPGPAPGPATCCCVVAVREAQAGRLLRMYSARPWHDAHGNRLPGRCLIRRLRDPAQAAGLAAFPYRTRPEPRGGQPPRRTFTLADLRRLPELNPPAPMPNGNVGTPLRVFLDLIRACRLPPRVITKLRLTFPKTGSSRRYGNVPFRYRDAETAEREEIPESGPGGDGDQPGPGGEAETSGSDEDDDRGEEWERHEALHEDVTAQERSAPRLFEEEIELQWEKGGPGLVFYTDAQYWRQEDGDFDERTADDWDVDVSVYYDRDGGDKDARDSVQMRWEQRLRAGEEDGSVAGRQLGTFERHTKGIGRRLMERQGWAEGQGLGSTNLGRPEALDGDGQDPRCKRGLGYHGEKLQPFRAPKRPRGDALGLISTIYDEPRAQDQGDRLLRRQPPTSMKYRAPAVPFVPASDRS
ncbi:LOW QUALITY PROTEIN: G patch domain-containing protein 3 [Tachyglossus aculeatus]|uniref:LOW QUALITY PROTEIN: G patch domain-containing protein 3 n=1 Tax=Tachyglossus aculeatus TaxID=9261 RepID=UPI0018F4FF4F|nr:LOW QUALITY PROTEIN: G patch domain-containing protein 3 [Tachyglossus aculeatus]